MKDLKEKILDEFDEMIKGNLIDSDVTVKEELFFYPVRGIKDFISKAMNQVEEYYEKELKIADDRWKTNEHYREEYDQLLAECKLDQLAYDETKRTVTEAVLNIHAVVIDRLYLKYKEGFCGGNPHRLGFFKERVKSDLYIELNAKK